MEELQPILISSREGMQGVVADIIRNKLKVAALTVEMEKEIADVQKRYQKRIDPVNQQIAVGEAGVQIWAQKNRAEFPGEKKSIDLPMAIVGFRQSPPSVEKKKKVNWDNAALLLRSVKIEKDGAVLFDGTDYVVPGKPTLDKNALLRDIKNIPAEALEAAGIYFEQDEIFYIKPKSEVVEGTRLEAA
jgi:phage host-nuclease inhibitor protein Gam